MPMIDAVLAEFQHEAATTRRLLERVPEQKFDWKPHEKSMTLGQLTHHIAEMPGWMAVVGHQDELDMAQEQERPEPPTSTSQLLELYDQSVETFRQKAAGLSDGEMMKPWKLRSGEEIHFEIPRAAAVRTFILNHLVHHRGQLSVYLRLLEVPLPSIYGPTADDRSFG